MGSVGIGFGLNFFNGNLLPNIEKLISRFFSLFRSFAVFAAKKRFRFLLRKRAYSDYYFFMVPSLK
jgi:hypothetical protein